MHINVRKMQSVLESKLSETLGMTFLATEYVTDYGDRIGTLAIDTYGALAIITYKRTGADRYGAGCLIIRSLDLLVKNLKLRPTRSAVRNKLAIFPVFIPT